MRKNIWIFNHYASNMFKDQAGRHYWIAQNLIKQGYNPTIFCASTIHNSNEIINTGNKKFILEKTDSIPFVFVKTPEYLTNGRKRIENMIAFYKNLFPVAKDYASIHGKPDLILASSVHPLTLVAGIKLAKKFDVQCICEVRDLWPETLVEYGTIKKDSLFANLLYLGEKWIYKKADRLIFTMEGGKSYINDKDWSQKHGGPIDINKIYHINNGVDLTTYNKQKLEIQYVDTELEDKGIFKIIYAGSLGKANSTNYILETAKIIQDKGYLDIKFLIFGSGPLKKEMEKYCKEYDLKNVSFKGRVDKTFIPNILSKGNLNIFTGQKVDLYKFGLSLNKMFDYMASGKPTISNIECGFDNIEKYKCGFTVKGGNAEYIVEGILKFYSMSSNEYANYCSNALKAAEDFDYKYLTSRLINIINNGDKEGKL